MPRKTVFLNIGILVFVTIKVDGRDMQVSVDSGAMVIVINRNELDQNIIFLDTVELQSNNGSSFS